MALVLRLYLSRSYALISKGSINRNAVLYFLRDRVLSFFFFLNHQKDLAFYICQHSGNFTWHAGSYQSLLLVESQSHWDQYNLSTSWIAFIHGKWWLSRTFSNTLRNSQFKHTAHTASNYTHVHWDMKWISLWASTKSLLFCLYSKFGSNFTMLFYLFGCFLGVYRRTKAVHELHVWNSQIWLVASWSTENMGPRRGQSRTVH